MQIFLFILLSIFHIVVEKKTRILKILMIYKLNLLFLLVVEQLYTHPCVSVCVFNSAAPAWFLMLVCTSFNIPIKPCLDRKRLWDKCSSVQIYNGLLSVWTILDDFHQSQMSYIERENHSSIVLSCFYILSFFCTAYYLVGPLKLLL